MLKPGGTLAIFAESYKRGKSGGIEGFGMKLIKAAYLTADKHRELLASSGYKDVLVFEEHNKGWLCVIGKKSDLQSFPLTLPEQIQESPG